MGSHWNSWTIGATVDWESGADNGLAHRRSQQPSMKLFGYKDGWLFFDETSDGADSGACRTGRRQVNKAVCGWMSDDCALATTMLQRWICSGGDYAPATTSPDDDPLHATAF